MSKKGWYSGPVRWLLETTGFEDPIVAIRWKADRLIARYGKMKPPFVPEEIARFRSVIKVERHKDLGQDGLLIPVNGGFIIRLNATQPFVRQNFSCAHEIGHTFFFDLSTSPPQKARGQRGYFPKEYDDYEDYQEEETLCNQAATELLMPLRYFEEQVRKVDISADSVVELASLFRVSVPATARRLVESKLWHCIIFESQFVVKGPPEIKEKLCISWVVKPKVLKNNIARYTPISERSSIFRTYLIGGESSLLEVLDLGDLKGKFWVDSRSLSEDGWDNNKRQTLLSSQVSSGRYVLTAIKL